MLYGLKKTKQTSVRWLPKKFRINVDSEIQNAMNLKVKQQIYTYELIKEQNYAEKNNRIMIAKTTYKHAKKS